MADPRPFAPGLSEGQVVADPRPFAPGLSEGHVVADPRPFALGLSEGQVPPGAVRGVPQQEYVVKPAVVPVGSLARTAGVQDREGLEMVIQRFF